MQVLRMKDEENHKEHDHMNGNDKNGHRSHHDHEGHTHESRTKHQGGQGCGHEGHDHSAHAKMFRNRFFVSLFFTIPILLLSPLIQSVFGYSFDFAGSTFVQVALASVLFFYGGWPFLEGLYSEVKNRQPGMMTLISIAIVVAYVFSLAVVFGLEGEPFFWELATLITIMLAGHWIEMRSIGAAQNAIASLRSLIPDEANRVVNGSTESVSVSALTVGDIVRVKPGERVPADGRIVSGSANLDESIVTGESAPVDRSEGEDVVAGVTVASGSIDIEVMGEEGTRFLDRVTELVEAASKEKSKAQRLADRAAAWLAYVGIGAGIATFISWMAITGDMTLALRRTATVLIIACPHALGLAIPLVVSVSTTKAAKAGAIIRNRTAFESAFKVDTVLFDKTGTLTYGRMRVVDIDADDPDEAIRIAAALESRSEHPIARAVLEEAERRGVDVPEATGFESQSGAGVSAKVGRTQYRIMSPKAASREGFEAEFDGTGFFLISGEKRIAKITLRDTARPEAKEAVESLQKAGIETVMLTGDHTSEAERIARELGIDTVHAEVSPEDKQRIVSSYPNALMAGDGVNDAPALAKAMVSCAIGSGTDVAAQSADVILASDDPRRIAWLIRFSKAVRTKTVQNLWWAAGYNILAIPLAAGVLASVGFVIEPAVGAVIMSLSTVIVALNAQLLRRHPIKMT